MAKWCGKASGGNTTRESATGRLPATRRSFDKFSTSLESRLATESPVKEWKLGPVGKGTEAKRPVSKQAEALECRSAFARTRARGVLTLSAGKEMMRR